MKDKARKPTTTPGSEPPPFLLFRRVQVLREGCPAPWPRDTVLHVACGPRGPVLVGRSDSGAWPATPHPTPQTHAQQA